MYSPFRHIPSIFWKKRPIQLTFFVTRKCNARCPFCFYLKNTNSNEHYTEYTSELTLSEIQQVSRSLGNLLWLAFSGGEIFLRKDLAEISQIFFSQNKPAIMLYPTNGLLPALIKNTTEQILKNCPHSTIVVKLSIDGLNKDHDKLRATPGSFEKTMQTYRLLAKLLDKYSNFELGMNTVFCSENQDKMTEIIEFAKGLQHIKTHTISMVRGDLKNKSYQQIDTKKYLQAIAQLEDNLHNGTASTYRFKGARIKAAQDVIQRNLIHQILMKKNRLINCYAGKLNLVLSETGNVYPCEMLSSSFGNVRDYSYNLKDVCDSNEAKTLLSSIHHKQCFCTHECYMMTNILFNPVCYPALAKEAIRIAIPHLERKTEPALGS